MKKVVGIKKGYTITVDSWENDGDLPQTISETVDTIEEAHRIYKICTELFPRVGNSSDREDINILVEYIQENRNLFPVELQEKNPSEIFDYFYELAGYLMGYSEYYDFRVCEKVTVTYSPEDILVDEITF